MATISAVKGPLATESLGTTLMHEHVFVLSTEVAQNYDTGWDEEREVEGAIERLNDLKAGGVDTIVDLTVLGLGRYIPRIQRVAAATDLNIVVATGIYAYSELPMYFFARGPGRLLGGPDQLPALFIKDIREGIADTGVRAAVLKCATDEPGVTEGVERALRGVAAAHRETGVPISTHTHAASEQGLAQQKIFLEEGVDLSRVVIGHSGDTTDIDYLRKLTDSGSYIGMDRFGADPLLSFEDRVNTVARMVELGYSSQIVLSHDLACTNDWLDDDVVAEIMPNWDFLHIHRDVLPALKSRGVSDADIHTMLVENPKAIFDRQGAY